ncbi:MAG: SusC/RagA family TonB-linked outer membrane protein, partial [Bacteroidetes bacterium]
SASVSFVFTDAFDLSSKLLTYGKIRGSFSEVGNDTGPYQLTPVYLVNSNGITSPSPDATAMPFNGVSGSTLSNIERNPDLRPERTREYELGLELKLWESKIGLDASVYTRESRDQIIPISIPRSSGFSSLFTNAGVVSNKGVEVGLDITPVELQNSFRWNLYGTFTLNRNEIQSLVEGTDELILRNTFAGSVQAVHIVGQPYGLIKGTVSARDDEGNLLIDPSNGQLINDLTPRVIGNPNPDYIVGLTNTLSWKGLSLSFVFDWKQGGDMYSVTNLSLLGRGVTTDSEDREVNVIIPGVYGDPNTAEPIRDENGNKTQNTTAIEVNGLYFGNSFAINGQDEWSVWDATVIRLREVGLSYTLPASLIDKTPFGSASISLTGRNLWYNAPNFPKGSNFDPETSQFGNSNAQGFEFTSAPSVKRYGVNLRFTF